MDWNAAAPAAIIGAVVAILGVFAVEMWLKPQLARWRVASILAVEIRLNLRLIDAAVKHRLDNPELVSESFQLSQRAWEVAADEIHYLPESALRPLLLLYNQFEEHNNLVEGHSRKGDLLLQMPQGPQAIALFQEFQDNARLYGEILTNTRAQSERTLPHLERLLESYPGGMILDE